MLVRIYNMDSQSTLKSAAVRDVHIFADGAPMEQVVRQLTGDTTREVRPIYNDMICTSWVCMYVCKT